MKNRYIIVALLSVWIAFTSPSCTTNQQSTSYKTLYSTEQVVTASLSSYNALVIKGKIPTNDVPRIAKAYNIFQGSLLLALDAARYNTNALTPPALQVEAQDLVNLINTIKAKGTK